MITPEVFQINASFACAGGRSGHQTWHYSSFFLLLSFSFHLLFSQKGFAYDFDILHAFLSSQKKNRGEDPPFTPQIVISGWTAGVRYGKSRTSFGPSRVCAGTLCVRARADVVATKLGIIDPATVSWTHHTYPPHQELAQAGSLKQTHIVLPSFFLLLSFHVC